MGADLHSHSTVHWNRSEAAFGLRRRQQTVALRSYVLDWPFRLVCHGPRRFNLGPNLRSDPPRVVKAFIERNLLGLELLADLLETVGLLLKGRF